MSKIKIVTDSSCMMESELIEKLGITVVPLSVMIDGTIYMDDDQFTGELFMGMMADAKALPKTSQPPIGIFLDAYDKLGEDGSEVLSIHMTETLSGTVNTARQAKQLTHTPVTVVDSLFTDQALSFQVIRAAEMAQQGASLQEILSEIEEIKKQTKLYIGIATLENLVKGGRISKAAGLVSSFLNMKVMMEFKNGELQVQSKGRGVKTFNKWFEELKKELESIQAQKIVKQIGISYAGKTDIILKFKEELQQMFPQMHIPFLHTSSIISTHTGEGAFSIMFYTEDKI